MRATPWNGLVMTSTEDRMARMRGSRSAAAPAGAPPAEVVDERGQGGEEPETALPPGWSIDMFRF